MDRVLTSYGLANALQYAGGVRPVAILIAAATAAGCIGFDDINQKPSAEINDPAAGADRFAGDTVTLDAFKSRDPDGDALRYEWRARSCDDAGGVMCDLEHFDADTSRSGRFTFQIPEEDKRTVRVELDVFDIRGARATTQLVLAVGNREPTVSIQVQPAGDVTVGRPVTFIAVGQDDDTADELTYTWSLSPARGSVPENVEWTAVDDRTQHLRPDIAGLWRVEVEVNDGDGGTDSTEAAVLIVEDQPPCIETTDPAAVVGARYVVDRAEGPRRFAVGQVSDDLDPYPPPADGADAELGEADFHWFVASPDSGGAFAEVAGHGVADLTIDPAAYAPGDVIDLRVEVTDRVARTLPCDASQATCSIGGNACVQRVTWGVEIR